MKKNQLKLLIKNIIKEAAVHEIFGLGKKKQEPQPTQQQQAVIDLLTKRGFEFEGMNTLPNGGIVVARLSRPYGKGNHGGPRYAFVFPDGKINQDRHDVNSFLKVVGEATGASPMIKPSPTVSPAQKKVIELLVKRGWNQGQHDEQGNVVLSKSAGKFGNSNAVISSDGKVNGQHLNDFLSMGESMSRPQDKRFNNGREEAPMGAVNIGEGFHDPAPCSCGSGEDSYWELDGRGIPLVRACPKCRKEKLSKYRPEILKHYTQADVDEPIEPDDYEENISEMTATGAVAGYSTPFAFSKKKQGSSRAIAAAKKYGKVVKSISETEDK